MKLSVIVNNYNYARFLGQAIDSALGQLSGEDELIVVDDGSTDGSREVLLRYAETPGVCIVEQANQGQLGAMLAGLEQAHGDLLLMLDADDYYLAGYLRRLRELSQAHPEVDMFFSAAQPGGDCQPRRLRAIEEMLEGMALEPGVTGSTRWATLYTGEYVGSPTSGLALRRELADRILAVREGLKDTLVINRRICRLLRLPADSHSIRRLSGDGIMVRIAGALGSLKYYNRQPAFFYRIHNTNAFARINRLGRIYLRLVLLRQFPGLMRKVVGSRAPDVEAVIDEARGRSRPLRRKRRLRLTLNYLYIAARARGGLRRKLAAMILIPRLILGRR